MNEVNHAAAKSNADFLKTVSTMRDIFGEVQANVAPAFGGQSLIIKTDQEFADLSALLSQGSTPPAPLATYNGMPTLTPHKPTTKTDD